MSLEVGVDVAWRRDATVRRVLVRAAVGACCRLPLEALLVAAGFDLARPWGGHHDPIGMVHSYAQRCAPLGEELAD